MTRADRLEDWLEGRVEWILDHILTCVVIFLLVTVPCLAYAIGVLLREVDW